MKLCTFVFQDTCVALQALAQYAAGTYTGSYDLKIITKMLVILVQKVEIQNVPSDVAIEASGNGCAVVQVILTLTQAYFLYLHKDVFLCLNPKYVKVISEKNHKGRFSI